MMWGILAVVILAWALLAHYTNIVVTTWRKVPKLLVGYNVRRWQMEDGTTHVDDENLGWEIMQSGVMGPAPQQYTSKAGFMLVWPFCFYAWYQARMQTPGVPGSERGIYLRVGLARWDINARGYIVPTFRVGFTTD